MAHVRADTLCRCPEWWKHLKWQKRNVSKRERRAAQKQMEKETNQDIIDKEPTMWDYLHDLNF
jgi:hypothetical protein